MATVVDPVNPVPYSVRDVAVFVGIRFVESDVRVGGGGGRIGTDTAFDSEGVAEVLFTVTDAVPLFAS
jgi:hypothetical protein